MVGERPNSTVFSSSSFESWMLSSWRPRGTRTDQPRSRKWRLISPMMFGVAVVLTAQRAGAERSKCGHDGLVADIQLDGKVAARGAALQQRRERGTEVVHDLVGQVEPSRHPGEHELGDAFEAVLARDRQHDPVGCHDTTPAPTTAPSS